MQGWRKRQEDSHITDLDLGPSNNTQIFAVFDGHGGSEVAKYVANHFTEEFLKNQNYLRNDIKKALEENYQKMDTLMLEKEGSEELLAEYQKSKEEAAKIKENNKNSQIEMLRQVIDPKEQPDAKISMFTGCTANVLVIQDKKLFFANAGDSRSVICKKGQAFPMSVDHKPSIPAELKRIEKAGGWVSDGRVLGNLNLSRGLGDSEYNQQLYKYHQEKINFCRQINDIISPLAMNGKLSYDLELLYTNCRDALFGKEYYKDKPFNNVILDITVIEPLMMEEGETATVKISA